MHAQRLALAALALMASLPLLVPLHTTPIPSFHAEWLAAALGLLASIALIGARRFPLPGVALLALALAATALLQTLLGRQPVPQLTTFFVEYLLWAALLAVAAHHLADRLGRARVVRTLALAILAGSMLCALAGIAQPWLAGAGWPGFPLQQGGPLGQRNHLTAYLWLGLASALYLRSVSTLSTPVFWSAAVFLATSCVLVGQRSSFLYVVALVVIAYWQARREGGPAFSGGRRRALGLGLLFVALQPVTLLMPAREVQAWVPPALRATQEMAGPSVRLQLLRVGMEGIAAAPLLGNGIGSYPNLSIDRADFIRPADNPGPSEHAHNLPTDLAVELGLPATLLVLAAGVVWFRRLSGHSVPADAEWAAGVVAVLCLHSLVEYPLWHSYFLGLLVVVTGIFSVPAVHGRRLPGLVLVASLLFTGGASLAALKHDYGYLEDAHARKSDAATLLQIAADSPLSPWVSATACFSLDPLSVGVADGLAVCTAALAFVPNLDIGVKAAVLQWRNGDVATAHELLRRYRLASLSNNPQGVNTLFKPLLDREPRLHEIEHPS